MDGSLEIEGRIDARSGQYGELESDLPVSLRSSKLADLRRMPCKGPFQSTKYACFARHSMLQQELRQRDLHQASVGIDVELIGHSRRMQIKLSIRSCAINLRIPCASQYLGLAVLSDGLTPTHRDKTY